MPVADLVKLIQVGLSEAFPRSFWVEGEVSSFQRARQGHLYFSLKDEKAQVSAVVWASQASRLRIPPEDGMAVLARVTRVDFYAPSGRLSVHVDAIEPRGAGAMAQKLEANRRRFAAEGLFDAARKRQLPFLPKTIGVVTARSGAVIHDIRRTIDSRFPKRQLLLRPARVQGAGAAADIAEAIDDLNREGSAEVLIVGRGGGSAEDLWAFNEEPVVRAIARSKIPVVSAVGHESDWSLADQVADLRAATPTAAAQLVVPREAELRSLLTDRGRRLASAVDGQLRRCHLYLDRARAGVGDPRRVVRDRRLNLGVLAQQAGSALHALTPQRRNRLQLLAVRLGARLPRAEQKLHALDTMFGRLQRQVANCLQSNRTDLASLARQLEVLSPLSILDRGFSLVRREDGTIVRRASDLEVGEALDLRFSHGTASARVLDLELGDLPEQEDTD